MLLSPWPCLRFPCRSSSTTTTSPIRSAAFPSASSLRSSLSAADGYAAPLDPAVLQKEALRGREAKAERAQTDNNVYTSKLPSGANLEQSPSPIKAMESRPLPASGAGSSHHYGRGQGKSQQHHHPLDQQHAASGSEQHSREKSQSKRFPMQEQELRALGKSTTTAANFTDVIIMHQMSCDKGQQEKGSLGNHPTSDGQKLKGRGRDLWPDTHFISLLRIFGCTFWILAPSAPQVCLSLCFLVVVLFQT